MAALKQKNLIFVCVLLAAAGPIAKAAPPTDAPDDATAKSDIKISGSMASVAVVDMIRLYNASGAALAYERKAIEIDGDAQQRLKTITRMSQLAPAELQEFVVLAGRDAPTDAEQKRMKELQALSDGRGADYRALQGKADLTPTDKANSQAFAEQEKLFRDQMLPNITEGFRQNAAEKMAQFRDGQMTQIRAIVGQVAKQKRITHVFDNSVLVYCENDLTAAVLLKLKKK